MRKSIYLATLLTVGGSCIGMASPVIVNFQQDVPTAVGATQQDITYGNTGYPNGVTVDGINFLFYGTTALIGNQGIAGTNDGPLQLSFQTPDSTSADRGVTPPISSPFSVYLLYVGFTETGVLAPPPYTLPDAPNNSVVQVIVDSNLQPASAFLSDYTYDEANQRLLGYFRYQSDTPFQQVLFTFSPLTGSGGSTVTGGGFTVNDVIYDPSPAPEPGTYLLLISGVLAIGASKFLKSKA